MIETRRNFMTVLAAAGAAPLAGAALVFAQRPIIPPPKPAPAETQNPAEIGTNPRSADAAKRALLLKNEKEFREGVERLYQIASELREEVAKTMTRDVFSVRMVKKTEEIEKLAKFLKSKAKGA